MGKITIRTIVEEINNHLAENFSRPAQNKGWEKKYPQDTEFLKVYTISHVERMIEDKFRELSSLSDVSCAYFHVDRSTILLKNSWLSFKVKRKKTNSVGWDYSYQMTASEVVLNDDRFMDMTPQDIVNEVVEKINKEEKRKNDNLQKFEDRLAELNITPVQFLNLKKEYELIDFNNKWDFEKKHRGW